MAVLRLDKRQFEDTSERFHTEPALESCYASNDGRRGMHLHGIGHLIRLWAEGKIGSYLLDNLWAGIKEAFLNSSAWRALTAPLFFMTFPFERMFRMMRTIAIVLLFAGMIGTAFYVVRRAQLPTAC